MTNVSSSIQKGCLETKKIRNLDILKDEFMKNDIYLSDEEMDFS